MAKCNKLIHVKMLVNKFETDLIFYILSDSIFKCQITRTEMSSAIFEVNDLGTMPVK
jgi:hypothetical protein